MATSTDKHLSNSEFLTRLSSLFPQAPTAVDSASTKPSHGSVFLTQKPYILPNTTNDKSTSIAEDLQPREAPVPILIRASDGTSSATSQQRRNKKLGEKKTVKQKVKLSTVVQPEDLDGFFANYAEVCREGMGRGMKKRDRKKDKARAKDRKKKGKGDGKDGVKGGKVEK